MSKTILQKYYKRHKKYIPYIVCILVWILTFLIGYVYSWLKFLPPHFHANFAIHVDWKFMDFSDDTYMEDIAGCGLSDLMFPKDRVHLHENNGETIHVHHEWVSWGHFFTNIRILFWENFISLDNGDILFKGENKRITFILNGEKVKNPFNTLIKSEDKLLINYWGEGEKALERIYSRISNNAGEHNDKYDPGSCGGTNEGGMWAILKDLFSFWHKH